MNETTQPAVAGPVKPTVRPVAAHMLTTDGSRHHLRFDAREVERTAKHMQQRCVMLYDQAAIDAAVAAERERCAAVLRYWLAGYAPDTVASYEARCLAHILDGRPAPEGPNY